MNKTDSKGGIDFPTPNGFSPPEGTADGAEFSFLGTAKLKNGGKTLCVYTCDGLPVGGGDSEYKEVPQSTEEEAGEGEADQGDQGATTGQRMVNRFQAKKKMMGQKNMMG